MKSTDFTLHTFQVEENKSEATLIYRRTDIESKGAIIYVHGFIDYFFQTEMALWFNNLGFDFVAIDLRRYGRNLRPEDKPNFIGEIKEYFQEIDYAIKFIEPWNVSKIILNGHSTGGLTTALYAHYHSNISGLILNSPFFDFNVPAISKLTIPLLSPLGKWFPYLEMSKLPQTYPMSLHIKHKGEWDFNTQWKPIENFPTYLGWIRAIHLAQQELQSGLNIQCPIVVLHSDKSYKGLKWSDEVLKSDAVLDVEHIKKYAKNIGKNTTIIEIKNGLHDLVLSQKESRMNYYQKLEKWLMQL